MNEERYKLIEELKNNIKFLNLLNEKGFEDIADFIIADRARIVEPLLKKYTDEERDTYGSFDLLYNDVQETLKRAGVEIC